MRQRLIVVAVLFCLCSLRGLAQPEEIIDLAVDVVATKQIRPGPVTITIVNLIPTKTSEYTIEYTITPLIEQPIPIQGIFKPAAPAGGTATISTMATGASTSSTCSQAEKDAVADAAKAADEKEIGKVRPTLVAASGCAEAKLILVLTEYVLSPRDLDPGDVLDVTIKRGTVKTWTRRFTTGRRGDWLTGYGLHFVPNRDRHYSSASIGNNRYKIRRSRDRESLDYIPTITFAFMRPKEAPESWFSAPIFGLAYDFNSVSGSVGYSIVYNHNFAVSVGCQIHQQRRLRGQFEEDQEIGENLDNAALTETTWAPNLYVGLSIRSLTNLFSGR